MYRRSTFSNGGIAIEQAAAANQSHQPAKLLLIEVWFLISPYVYVETVRITSEETERLNPLRGQSLSNIASMFCSMLLAMYNAGDDLSLKFDKFASTANDSLRLG